MTHASESGHWYDRQGTPVYQVPSADGKSMVTPDIRHARKLGLLPGFTSINRMLYSYGLERYKIRQGILAALTLPRNAGEDDESYLKRLDDDRQAHARGRADEGTEIHAAVQGAIEGGAVNPKWAAQINAVQECLVRLPEGCLIDLKTKESIEGKKDRDLFFDDHVMQLAAYARGIHSGVHKAYVTEGVNEFRCEVSFAHPLGYGGKVDILRLSMKPAPIPLVSIIISVKEPGLVMHKIWGDDEVKRGLSLFDAALEIWKLRNNYRSEWR